ncbi:MAG TPA: hypothetical protein DDW52_22445 [Planctomycetaceae bacterium]|nr:hypothetical protein [Planctomycetaceae bacterium]
MSDEHTYSVESRHASGNVVVFEDDGTSAWLYLLGRSDGKPISDVWVHNRVKAPNASEIKNYRDGPPPAASGFSDDSNICEAPELHDWTFVWRPDGEAVTLHRDGHPVALLLASQRRGWSRNLTRNGPWGNTWDDGTCSAKSHSK